MIAPALEIGQVKFLFYCPVRTICGKVCKRLHQAFRRNSWCIVDYLIYPQNMLMAHDKISENLIIGMFYTRLSEIPTKAEYLMQCE